MKRILLVINLILTIGFLIAFQQAKKFDTTPKDSTDIYRTEDLGGTALRPEPIEIPLTQSGAEQMEKVLTNNLFHEDRKLDPPPEAPPEEGQADPGEAAAEQFELVSILRVGTKAGASIVFSPKNQPPEEPRSRIRRRTPNRDPGNPRANRSQEGEKNKNKGFYMLNDPVGESGYDLKEIGTDSVTLGKSGQEDITVYLDTTDENSTARFKEANDEEQRKLDEQEQQRQQAHAVRHGEETTGEPPANVEGRPEQTPSRGLPPGAENEEQHQEEINQVPQRPTRIIRRRPFRRTRIQNPDTNIENPTDGEDEQNDNGSPIPPGVPE